jgi:hypothetical protein
VVTKYKELEQEAQSVADRLMEDLSLKYVEVERSVRRLHYTAKRQRDRVSALEGRGGIKVGQEPEEKPCENCRTLVQEDAETDKSKAQAQEEYWETRLFSLRKEYQMNCEALLAEERQSHACEMEKVGSEKSILAEESQILRAELARLRVKAETDLAEMLADHKQEVKHLKASLQEQQSSLTKDYEARLEEMQTLVQSKEDEMQTTLERLKEGESSAVSSLQDQLLEAEGIVEELHTVLRAIGEIVHPTYLKHSGSDKDWALDYSRRKADLLEQLQGSSWCADHVLEVEFACFYIGKLTTDNDWLIERLAEFGKENEWLKQQTQSLTPKAKSGLHRQVMEDIRTASVVMDDYNSARERLVKQFHRTDRREVGRIL